MSLLRDNLISMCMELNEYKRDRNSLLEQYIVSRLNQYNISFDHDMNIHANNLMTYNQLKVYNKFNRMFGNKNDNL